MKTTSFQEAQSLADEILQKCNPEGEVITELAPGHTEGSIRIRLIGSLATKEL